MNRRRIQFWIYQIRNLITNRIYIGATTQFEVRIISHMRALRRGVHISKLMQEDYDKHGEDSFEIEMLDFIFVKKFRKGMQLREERELIADWQPEYNTHKYTNLKGSQKYSASFYNKRQAKIDKFLKAKV